MPNHLCLSSFERVEPVQSTMHVREQDRTCVLAYAIPRTLRLAVPACSVVDDRGTCMHGVVPHATVQTSLLHKTKGNS